MATVSTAIPDRTFPLREEVESTLERVSEQLVQHADGDGHSLPAIELERLREFARFLGQVVAGWPDSSTDALPSEGAGFGSTVTVQDIGNGGGRGSYTLMTGAIIDVDAGQVSLESPMGHALLGARAGDVVEVELPQRHRKLRVLAVRTLRDRLLESAPIAATRWGSTGVHGEGLGS